MADYSFEQLQVLIVEDNKHMRALLRAMLNVAGIKHIQEAASGDVALDLLHRSPCDIVFSDMSMTPMDGLTFTRTLRADRTSPNNFVPIIMITGHYRALPRGAGARRGGDRIPGQAGDGTGAVCAHRRDRRAAASLHPLRGLFRPRPPPPPRPGICRPPCAATRTKTKARSRCCDGKAEKAEGRDHSAPGPSQAKAACCVIWRPVHPSLSRLVNTADLIQRRLSCFRSAASSFSSAACSAVT